MAFYTTLNELTCQSTKQKRTIDTVLVFGWEVLPSYRQLLRNYSCDNYKKGKTIITIAINGMWARNE
jgi:hypothetical protein